MFQTARSGHALSFVGQSLICSAWLSVVAYPLLPSLADSRLDSRSQLSIFWRCQRTNFFTNLFGYVIDCLVARHSQPCERQLRSFWSWNSDSFHHFSSLLNFAILCEARIQDRQLCNLYWVERAMLCQVLGSSSLLSWLRFGTAMLSVAILYRKGPGGSDAARGLMIGDQSSTSALYEIPTIHDWLQSRILR